MHSLALRGGRVAVSGAQPRTGRCQLVARAPCVGRCSAVRVVAAAFKPATVSETKQAFLKAYSKPIPSIYNTVVQELLVQMHFITYGKNFQYNEIYALGFVSVFDQIMEAMPSEERNKIFDAYIKALQMDPAQFRKDAEALEQTAGSLSGPDALVPDASGNAVQLALANVSDASAAGHFAYNKFFAIGLFRLLELTGAKEPAALERLVKSVGAKPEAVNRDLMLYKGILSKLSAAKELMKEFLDREKRKQAEREAEKAKRLATESNTPVEA